MKKLLSTKYSANAFNMALFVLRVGLGLLMINHGYDKLMHFSTYSAGFMSFLGLSKTISFSLVVFAEFFCSLFIILGLFTRLATVPLIIAMSVALFQAHKGDVFDTGQAAALFLTGFIVILLVGPGKASVDGLTGK